MSIGTSTELCTGCCADADDEDVGVGFEDTTVVEMAAGFDVVLEVDIGVDVGFDVCEIALLDGADCAELIDETATEVYSVISGILCKFSELYTTPLVTSLVGSGCGCGSERIFFATAPTISNSTAAAIPIFGNIDLPFLW